MKKKPIFILLSSFITILTNAYGQENLHYQDNTCCECYHIDTLELKKIIYYRPILNSLDPSYLIKVTSLSENIDINRFEKLFYIMSLDKQIKYQTSKILYYLEGSSDSISEVLKQELHSFHTLYTNKIRDLHRYTTACKELENIQKYIKKKTLIKLIDPSYLSQFITLTNITNEQDLLDYQAIIKFEQQFNDKLLIHIKKKNNPSVKLNYIDQESLLLLQELYVESNERIKKFTQEKINSEKTPKIFSEERLKQAQAKFTLKEIIRNGDTIAFNENKIELLKSFQTNSNSLIKDSTKIVKSDSTSFYVYDEGYDHKLACVDFVPGLFLSLQIGSHISFFAYEELLIKKGIYFKKASDGKILFSYGRIVSKEALEKAEKELLEKGITFYQLVAYNNGDFFPVEQAKKILLKDGF